MLKGKVDPYLECISERGQIGASVDSKANIEQLLDGESCESIKPRAPELDTQQVSPIAVLERCKSNYQQKQWDVGTFLLYDAERVSKLISGTTNIPPPMPSGDPVGQCLLRADRNRESNLNCMNEYLSNAYFKESTSTSFWRYEKVTSSSSSSSQSVISTSSDDTDACIVFSGPAKKNDSALTTTEFRRCSHDYEDTGCIIPHMVWSSSSKNKVPVATLHSIDEVDPLDREQTANTRFAEAKKMAMAALTKLENFTDANLEVVLFSGEGDALHQIFDCIVMGPYSRIDFWDRGVAKDLDVPFWARDASEVGVDRSMDLPCYGAKLKGDYNPPFTCGSDTRRSIIKYFVRDEINRDRYVCSIESCVTTYDPADTFEHAHKQLGKHAGRVSDLQAHTAAQGCLERYQELPVRVLHAERDQDARNTQPHMLQGVRRSLHGDRSVHVP